MKGETLLVGSIPLPTTTEALRTFGETLGPHLASLPDGEVGWRQFWITRVHFQVLAIHPDIEVVQQPRRDDGVERIYPHDATDNWNFRVRPGVEKIVFGHPGWRLGFYQDALNSYEVFKEMKAQGRLPKALRFQVSIPTAVSALPPRCFPTPGDLEKVRSGYIDAVRAEVAAILQHIPANELAIQWDCSTELQDAYGMVKGLEPEGMIARNLGQVHELSKGIPDDALIGFHLCFGTLGGWPRFEPPSMDKAVELANAFIAGAGRRVDWMHIPVLDRSDETYYAPLANLNPKEARIFLGMIHNMSTFAVRLAAARKHLKDFGVAAYCGFGRRPKGDLPEILRDHVSALDMMRG